MEVAIFLHVFWLGWEGTTCAPTRVDLTAQVKIAIAMQGRVTRIMPNSRGGEYYVCLPGSKNILYATRSKVWEPQGYGLASMKKMCHFLRLADGVQAQKNAGEANGGQKFRKPELNKDRQDVAFRVISSLHLDQLGRFANSEFLLTTARVGRPGSVKDGDLYVTHHSSEQRVYN